MANPRTIARLEARIHERAAYCLQFEVSDPRASFITVTRVELSSDITSGKIFYSVLGTEADKSKAAHMLTSAAGFIQRQIARVLDVRRMPHLRWVYDESAAAAADLTRLIAEARARDRAINPKLAQDDASEDVLAPSAGSAAAAVEHEAFDEDDDDEEEERDEA